MIVLDASVVVDLVTNGPLADSVRIALGDFLEPIVVPHLLDVEVVSALRGLAAGRWIDAHQVHQFLAALAALPAERFPHAPLLDRVWELRHNFTAYDATYIALAEATDAVLCTGDEKLTKGHRARVKLFAEPPA